MKVVIQHVYRLKNEQFKHENYINIIEVIYDKPTANNILYNESWFHPSEQTDFACHTLGFQLLQYEIQQRIRQKQKKNSSSMWERKLSLIEET